MPKFSSFHAIEHYLKNGLPRPLASYSTILASMIRSLEISLFYIIELKDESKALKIFVCQLQFPEFISCYC